MLILALAELGNVMTCVYYGKLWQCHTTLLTFPEHSAIPRGFWNRLNKFYLAIFILEFAEILQPVMLPVCHLLDEVIMKISLMLFISICGLLEERSGKQVELADTAQEGSEEQGSDGEQMIVYDREGKASSDLRKDRREFMNMHVKRLMRRRRRRVSTNLRARNLRARNSQRVIFLF